MREAMIELIAEERVDLMAPPFLEADKSPHFESMADLAVHYAGCGERGGARGGGAGSRQRQSARG